MLLYIKETPPVGKPINFKTGVKSCFVNHTYPSVPGQHLSSYHYIYLFCALLFLFSLAV